MSSSLARNFRPDAWPSILNLSTTYGEMGHQISQFCLGVSEFFTRIPEHMPGYSVQLLYAPGKRLGPRVMFRLANVGLCSIFAHNSETRHI
jgi:hypothetical protein